MPVLIASRALFYLRLYRIFQILLKMLNVNPFNFKLFVSYLDKTIKIALIVALAWQILSNQAANYLYSG